MGGGGGDLKHLLVENDSATQGCSSSSAEHITPHNSSSGRRIESAGERQGRLERGEVDAAAAG